VKHSPLNFKEVVRSVASLHVADADKLSVSLLLALDPRIPELVMGNESGLRTAVNRYFIVTA
jgi:hypothetical protein